MISASPPFAAVCMGYFFFVQVFFGSFTPLLYPWLRRKASTRCWRRFLCSTSSACLRDSRSFSSLAHFACSATRAACSAARASCSALSCVASFAASSSFRRSSSSTSRRFTCSLACHCTESSVWRCTSSAFSLARHCAASSSSRWFASMSSSSSLDMERLRTAPTLIVSVTGLAVELQPAVLQERPALPWGCAGVAMAHATRTGREGARSKRSPT
mmetsp:Transcript_101703/g.283164  ORF Transcript_101703/g.283164 Transcript_101703/m.283164 type:complete len:215 (+) Transcript_101703:298-942(+)